MQFQWVLESLNCVSISGLVIACIVRDMESRSLFYFVVEISVLRKLILNWRRNSGRNGNGGSDE